MKLNVRKITRQNSAKVIAIEYGHASIPRSNDKQAETYILPNGSIVDLQAATKYIQKMHRVIEEQLQLANIKKLEGQKNA